MLILGKNIPSPTGREIDAIEKDVKKQFERFKRDFDEYGVNLMCDS
jgi:hypothetical protein